MLSCFYFLPLNRSQIVVVNTIATYARSIVSIALVLFSSRWVLNALGHSDFGVFSVVGSIIVFITFLNNVMAGSVARYYSYSIGRGDIFTVKQCFNTALNIHICFAVVFVLIGWLIGGYCIENLLSIPVDRLAGAKEVFTISLVSAFVCMVSVPVLGMFTAKQRIFELAAFGLLQSGLSFLLAFAISQLSSGDKLVTYAYGMSGIIVVVQTSIVLRGISLFEECEILPSEWFNAKIIKDVSQFAAWNLIGSLGGTMRDQGASILLNLHFGTKINAAYGITMQMSAATNQLSTAMMGAFAPEMTRSEGSGDRERMLFLAEKTNKLGTLMMLFFAIPLLVEMDNLLRLWLKAVPEYTSALSTMVIVSFIIDRLTSGYMLAVNAYGKIAAYQVTQGGILLLTIPVAWLFLVMGFSPSSVGIAFVITAAGCSIGRVMWARRLFGVSMLSWMRTVLAPCFAVSLVSYTIALCGRHLMDETLTRLMLVSALSLVAIGISIWCIGLSMLERSYAIRAVKNAYMRIRSIRISKSE